MPTAFQLPYSEEASSQRSRRTFRKKILPVGSIAYEGRQIPFDRARLERIVANFRAGATHQVPLVLANDRNEHGWDPTRFRGEVLDLEAGPDGLYGLIEMTEDGAKLLEENPNLGVSASIREEPLVRADDGKTFAGDVLLHVLATMNPRLTKLSAFEPVGLSTQPEAVVDLTAARFEEEATMALTDEQAERLAKLADSPLLEKLLTEPEGNGNGNGSTTDEGAEDELTDEEEAELAALVAELEGAEEEGEHEPAESSLSNDDQAKLELALSHSEAAQAELAVMRSQVQAAEWAKTRAELERSGVPKADLDLAEPALCRPTIDLSVSDGPDLVGIIRGLLESRRGTIDFSGEVHDFGVGGGGNSQADALYDALKARVQKR